jgi:Bacterial mobilisation protein (MobC).
MAKKTINFDTRLYIKCSSEDKKIIKEKARKVGNDLSDYARNLLLNKKISSKTDLQTILELRKIGTNLNQITRKINSSSFISDPQEFVLKIEKIHEELEKIKSMISLK